MAEVVAWMVERVCHQMVRAGGAEHDDRIAAALAEACWRIIEPAG